MVSRVCKENYERHLQKSILALVLAGDSILTRRYSKLCERGVRSLAARPFQVLSVLLISALQKCGRRWSERLGTHGDSHTQSTRPICSFTFGGQPPSSKGVKRGKESAQALALHRAGCWSGSLCSILLFYHLPSNWMPDKYLVLPLWSCKSLVTNIGLSPRHEINSLSSLSRSTEMK